MKPDKIKIEDLEVFANHGVFPEENAKEDLSMEQSALKNKNSKYLEGAYNLLI